MPLSSEEEGVLDETNALKLATTYGGARKFLVFDWPKGAEKKTYWTTGGLVVGPHD
jgi:hypothetical protein